MMTHRNTLIAVLMLAASAQAQAQAQAPPVTEADLCRRQLALVHDALAARERELYMANDRLMAARAEAAATEARLATALEWVKAAQVEKR